MKKAFFLPALLLPLLLLLSGCSAAFENPLEEAEATLVPGAGAVLHSPVAGENDQDLFTAELYFRFQRQPYLAAESRSLVVGRDASLEKALVQALLDGPSAASPELKRCFSDQVRVVSAQSQGRILYVTFSQELLQPYADERGAGAEETRIRRQLSIQSLVATIIENLDYDQVQVMVQQTGGVQSGMRLPLSYFQTSQAGLAPPLTRDEGWLLTPHNTAQILLSLWQMKDWENLYQYIAIQDPVSGLPRPSQAQAYAALDACQTLDAYNVTQGQISLDGSRAVLTVQLRMQAGAGVEPQSYTRPLRLYRENGVWKVSYSQWLQLAAP